MTMWTQACIVARRELRDSLRDWRIVVPILILAVALPWVMNVSTQIAMNFVREYSAYVDPVRLVPFAIMIVGFFPISFSLFIALESFVGEKERRSLEPLLTTPISDGALYLGKLMAALVLPVVSSYVAVGVFVLWLNGSTGYVPERVVLSQILLLTTAEALIMVAGAVVVSSHTTSVRAANLLAAFIIVPVSLLLQGESVLLIWGMYDVLWYIIAALGIADLILVRTGMRTFRREEILGREIDAFSLGSVWRQFCRSFGGPARFSIVRVYREDVPRLLRENRLPIAVTFVVLVAGVGTGWLFAGQYPVPAGLIGPLHIEPSAFQRGPTSIGFDVLPSVDTVAIFENNVRSLTTAALLGLVSFGSLPLLLLLVPMGIVGFLAGEAAGLGYSPVAFFLAFIIPHGLFELPAATLATAFALRLGASMIAPPPGTTAGENVLHALADLVKIYVFVVAPLLLVAAAVEANITPQVALWFYGR